MKISSFVRKVALLSAGASTLVLNSCYFNSAQSVMAQASYPAVVDSSDIVVGQTIYYDGEDYYTYVPRFRYDYEIQTVHSAFPAFQSLSETDGKKHYTRMGQQFVEVPNDLAQYLIYGTGSSSGNLIPVSERWKAYCDRTYTVNYKPTQLIYHFDYEDPNAGWYYIAGIFDWLCVDLPMTCALTCAGTAIVFCTFGAVAKSAKNSYDYVGPISGDKCGGCQGTGTMYTGLGILPCNACNGTGRNP